MHHRVSPARVVGGAGTLAAVAAVLVVSPQPSADGVAVAWLCLMLVGPDAREDLLGLVTWIGGGAVLVGAIGWLAGSTMDGLVTPVLGAGSGIAVGGGLGAILQLLVVGESEPRETETMTVDLADGDADAAVPQPQPADLFDLAPDPILYFADTGGGPVVRAVNPAFESTFGVDAAAVAGAALTDALMVANRADDVRTAALDGDTFDAVVECETPDGTETLRVRVAAGGDGAAAGYVLYTEPTE